MSDEIMQEKHQPVLLQEAIDGLAIQPEGVYVDGTFGRGGHSQAILDRLSSKGKLLAIDKDLAAIQFAKEHFEHDERFQIRHGSFTKISEFMNELGLSTIDGLLLDLGVSSPQLEKAERGFSFLKEGPLDMRMDVSKGMDAASWVQQVAEEELVTVLKEYGEERFSKRIARAIVSVRQEHSIRTTTALARIVEQAVPVREKNKHPATRTFQAIRIYLNRELEELEQCLEDSLEYLRIKGRLVVISFHSLEDRIVKRFIKKNVKGDPFPPGLPVRQKELNPRLKAIGRAIRPSMSEVQFNPRARSAVLRIAEKIG
ncbi:MAG: 16S rRNA (cytosine(1402)-N(4))-methyltransferase RsmH [Pseudomonadota bacterium]|nr:16S rRNA (cytosine(1402)-N(4))-methyltransferase RsmH [Gammaproteobacteria bacterium]MBU1558471.1 16S rRNA (cytosine(1402)-N(4))-methyltransferase RsmH [Gammaproteobacteria bacterium]MBU1629240.1 16S rRNA (cytosine(1402)-N(4))-methyltransferase RsmH [Gammaproteobacteria bacterium]MBU2546173.1 16S rRNA (cytosine(1402)-N(4))-methyltransferase RsmH [Gammaproteobacteria bacterium]